MVEHLTKTNQNSSEYSSKIFISFTLLLISSFVLILASKNVLISSSLYIMLLYSLITTIIFIRLLKSLDIDKKLDETVLLSYIFLTLLPYYLIYAIRYPYISSWTGDAAYHVSKFWEVSNNELQYFSPWMLPGFYSFYAMLSYSTGTEIHLLGRIFHPMINLFSIILFYIFLKKILSPKMALLSSFLLGWDYFYFTFGFEFRTESFAIIFYLGILAVLYLIRSTAHKQERILSSIFVILFCGVIFTTHLVTIVHLLILSSLMFGVHCFNLFLRNLNRLHARIFDIKSEKEVLINDFPWVLEFEIIPLFLLLFLAFNVFLSFQTLFSGLFETFNTFLRWQTIPSDLVQTVSAKQGIVSFPIYGEIVGSLIWIGRMILIFGFIYFSWHFFRKRQLSHFFLIILAISYGILLLYFSFFGTTHSPNPSRIYHFFTIPATVMITFPIFLLFSLKKKRTNVITILIIVLLIFGSLAKQPSSIIGQTEPFRKQNPILDELQGKWTIKKWYVSPIKYLEEYKVNFTKVVGDEFLAAIFPMFNITIAPIPSYMLEDGVNQTEIILLSNDYEFLVIESRTIINVPLSCIYNNNHVSIFLLE